MQIKTIYLDMDGCSADWENHMLAQEEVKAAGILTIEELNKLNDRLNLIRDVYKRNPNFFNQLRYIDEFDHILDFVRSSGIPFHFLTCVGDAHHCFDTASSDKISWIQKEIHPRISEHIGKFDVITVKHHKDKLKYAEPDTIIVDDYHKNISQWREKGGKAVHFDLNKNDGLFYRNELERIVRESIR